MNPEAKPLSTADLARVSAQPTPDTLPDPPRVGMAGGSSGLLEPETAQGSSVSGSVREASPKGEPLARNEEPAPAPEMPGLSATAAAEAGTAPLFENKDAGDLRARWNEIQVGFVDEPRTAVERADSLVAETIKRLAESFAAGRQRLEGEWGGGGDASTETLRLSLQRYRSFFNRLLSI